MSMKYIFESEDIINTYYFYNKYGNKALLISIYSCNNIYNKLKNGIKINLERPFFIIYNNLNCDTLIGYPYEDCVLYTII